MVKMQAATLALVVVFGLLGCAPGPRPVLKRLYDGLKEPIEGIDLAGLKDRRIVIDPGHGGVFRGAIGSHGTEEAVVNLGVALHLVKLLEAAGVKVVLTRTADTDFVGGDSLRLRDDLRARVEIANRIDPDLFMSLHHNADPGSDDRVNEIQVYHRLADEGPSLDAARAVARHLVVNLGEERNQVLPGNYYVLRNAVSPGVLCEPSFISNPRIEAQIRLDEKQWLEAAAYFLAVVDYFSNGVPRVARLGLAGERSAVTDDARPLIEVVFDGTTLVDASAVDVTLDGVGLVATRVAFDRFVASAGGPLRGGRHTVRASGRAYGGNASREAALEFEVRTEPAVLALTADPPARSAPYPQKLTALVLDGNGNAAADSTRVDFSWEGGSATRLTRRGRASIFVGREIPFEVREVAARCSNLNAATAAPASDVAAYISGFVTDTDGKPISDATVALVSSEGAATTDEDGFFAIACDATPSGLEVSKPGFKQAHLDFSGGSDPASDEAAGGGITPNRVTFPDIRLERFYRDLPRDVTVTLDPEGGGEAAGWKGRAGVTAANLNLAVAERLRALLESVGITARLTRDTDRATTKVERLKAAEAAHSALVLSIAHAAGRRKGAALGHYPTSSQGARLAATLAAELKSSFRYQAPVADNAEYLIQQTSCPAAEVTFLSPRSAREDAALADPPEIWARSYALLAGILRYLGVGGQGEEPDGTFAISGVVTKAGKPVRGALVVLDGALETPTDGNGEFHLRLIERGRHTLAGLSESARSRAFAVDEGTGPIRLTLD